MNPIKSSIRNLIEQSGYHVASKSLFGYNAFNDIQGLLEKFPAPTVVDVGAFIGEFAEALLKVIPKVKIFCFEPDPHSFQRLTVAMESHPGVQPVNLAAADVAGYLDFYANEGPATNSFLKASNSGKTFMPPHESDCKSVRKTPVVRLDEYAREHRIEKMHLLKTDTQGFDLSVIRGAERLIREHRVKLIYCEVFFKELYENQSYFHDIHAYLLQQGMSLCGFYDIGRMDTGEMIWADALYIDPNFS